MPSNFKEKPRAGKFRVIQDEDSFLSEKAAQQIQELISSGVLKSGDLLPPERELCEQLGVSRTVIREAIMKLKARGLLFSRIGVGTFISEPISNILDFPMMMLNTSESKKVKDLQQAREVMEPAIATLAAQFATEEHIEILKQAIREMEDNLSNKHEYIKADNKFHITLAEATNNDVFQLFVNSIVDMLQEVRLLALMSPGAGERANIYHNKILEAIINRNPELARSFMEEHIIQINDDLRKSITSQGKE